MARTLTRGCSPQPTSSSRCWLLDLGRPATPTYLRFSDSVDWSPQETEGTLPSVQLKAGLKEAAKMRRHQEKTNTGSCYCHQAYQGKEREGVTRTR